MLVLCSCYISSMLVVCATRAAWQMGTGRVTDEMLRAHLPPPSDGSVLLLCGPPGFVKETCLPALERLGHARDHILIFWTLFLNITHMHAMSCAPNFCSSLLPFWLATPSYCPQNPSILSVENYFMLNSQYIPLSSKSVPSHLLVMYFHHSSHFTLITTPL